jgi:hypothetical protein
MARKSIRDFSGGLVTYQSELDISDNQFQEFDNAINTKRGSVTKKGTSSNKSNRNTSIEPINTEFIRYRTEKDGSGNDTSSQWWVLGNADKVYRAAVADGTSGSWATVNTYSTYGSEMVANGNFAASSDWTFGTGWSRVVGEPAIYALYTTGSGTGSLTQANADMTISLEKNKIYRLQFTLSNIGGAGKAGITIKNSALTETYVSFASYNVATHNVYFSPKESNSGIGFFAAETDGTTQTPTFRIDDISIKEFPSHDLLVHNQILRISDGSFLNDPKWYGHIKRNVFGQGITPLTHYRFRTPPMAAAVNAWTLEDTELTPPTVVPLQHAFDQENVIDAANEVGIFVYFPTTDALKLIDDAAANTFSSKDKYTVTFIYDYVQESELGRDTHGDIGVFSQNAVQSNRCPGIQLVVDTGTDLANWNKRITGINLYWQPENDVDWYLVTTYDVQDGFSDDPRAKDSSTESIIRGSITATSNNGNWIPCLEPYGATSNDTHDLHNTYSNYTATVLEGATNWSNASSFAADKAVIVTTTDITSNTLALFSAELEKPTTYIANIKSISSADLTTGPTSGIAVNWGNWRGEGYAQWATDIDLSAFTAFVCTVSTDKVATWYLPNDGLKLATYNSLTGRAAETRLKPIKWNTAAVVGNKAFYANIDFKDENDQTIREKNRIVFTDNFKLDEAVVGTKFLDVGKNDGDEITALHSAQNRLYVFKTRNIYVYRIQSSQSVNFILEKHIAGIGCLHKHAVVDTPYGICFADNRQVSLMRGTEISEVSLLIRDTYQGLDLQPNSGGFSLGYHANINTLIVNYDSTATMYAYNFDTQSWSKFDDHSGTFQSQFVITDDQELQTYDTTSERVENLFLSTSNEATSTVKLKTKRFDFGVPDQFKRFTKLHITYLGNGAASNLTVKVYIDGDSTASLTQTISDSTILTTDSFIINELGKSIEVEVSGIASNTRIDGIDIDYDIEGSNP